MNKMEGKSQSGGSNSGGVVKNRNSSGCLVIKKKPDGAGAETSGDRKVYESKKAKKRARVSAGDGDSSDEELLEYYRREGGGLGSGSGGYNDFGDMGFGRNRLMREGAMKRSKLDVYDFDEYDDLNDVEMMGARYYFEREMDVGGGSERGIFSPRMEMKSGSGSGDGMDFEGGSSKGDIIYKRRKSFHGSTGGEYYSMGKERFGGSDEAIRLQGKNGVLKVRVKNKEEVNKNHPQMYRPMGGNSVNYRGQELTAKSIIIQRHSPYSERNLPKKPVTAGGRTVKKPAERRKSWPAKSSEESDEESEDDHASAKFQSGSVKGRQPNKRGRRAGRVQSPEISQIAKAREGKVKRGTGTEKQLLREKIRSMLISAGWTIDYRPRRGRDYSDAVYINPSGTAFWSIIKAYDALQKQLEEDGKSLKASNDSSSLAPISEDTLSKLTRQTRKKIEKELKRKKREESASKKNHANRNFDEDDSDEDSSGSGRPDEKLSSYMKRSGKPSKSSSKDAWRDVGKSNRKLQEMGDKSSFRFIHGRKSNKIGRCTLLVRNSEKGHDVGTDGFVPYTGKRNLLSWLIDMGTVELSEKVHYMNRRRTKVMLEGWITRDGIHCGCCSKILTVTKFEIHAASKLRQPFQNIYLSSGPSLLQCLVDTWNKQDESLRDGFNKINVDGDDSNDDTCALCGDGGNLICCDSCPSTFHQNCLDIQVLPPGDWHCPHCSCKLCGLANVSTVEGDDTKEDILLKCSLCERKYHNSCVEMDISVVSGSTLPFCGKVCHEVFEKFQKLLGVKHELEDGLCWSLIHRTDLSSDNSLRSFLQRVEWNSKLAVALSIMDECFLPITDRRSGINIIHNVFYNCGSNFTRLNYNGFYTAVLERSDEIISAASIRIHGTQFAEMPFIGTRHIYRRQGMCRRLFSAIESALRSLNVDKLIIPAISELMDTWTRVFGFSTLEESDKREMKTLNMLVFPGTDMLQKKLVDQDGFEIDLKGVDSCDAADNPSDALDHTQTSDFNSSPGPSIATTSQDGAKVNDNSFNSRCSEERAISVQGASPEPRQDVVHEQVKPASHNTSANCSDEAMQVVPGDNPSDALDHTKTSDFDSSPGPSIVTTSPDGAKVNDNSCNSRCSEELAISVQGTSPEPCQDVVHEQVKPASHNTSANSSDEAMPVIPGDNPSDALDHTQTSDFGSSPGPSIATTSQDGAKVDDNSFNSRCSEEMAISVPGTSPEPRQDVVHEQVKLASHNTSANSSDEAMPVVPGDNPSDALDHTQTSDFDSSLGPSIATTSQDGAKVNDNSFNSRSSEEMAISVQGTSPEPRQDVVHEQVKPVSHNTSANSADEAMPVIPGDNPSDALDHTQTSDFGSSPGPSIATTSQDGAKVDDNSFNSRCSEEMAISVQETSPEPRQDVHEQVKPASHNTSANSSDEAVPVIPGEEEKGQDTTVLPLQTGMKLESIEHVKEHITSDTRENVDVTKNVLDSSTDFMVNGLSMDDKAHDDDSLSLSVQSAPCDQQPPISEEAHDDFSSKDTTTIIPGERSQVTTPSPMELDIKLNESSEHVNGHITSNTREDIDVPETEMMGNGLPMNDKAHNDDSLSLNVHDNTPVVTSDTREDIDVPENTLDSSTEMMGNGLPMNDKAHNDDSVSLNVHDTTPVVPCEESQVTAPSPMELDIKLKESSEDLEDHITSTIEDIDIVEKQDVSVSKITGNGVLKNDASEDDGNFVEAMPVIAGEGIQAASNPCLQLDIKSKESSEDLEEHITVTGEAVDIVDG
ncbi:uncharacterized protein LOC141619113 [Silene latifolia]|uniref:uncharacterized protein LOC141619113 n=1 Tax=Silene latifolia TaxID=37657 RepID=UPI003D77077D